jgi:amino acid adenylation domain-containing protein
MLMLDRNTAARWPNLPGYPSIDDDWPADAAFEYFDEGWIERPIADRFDEIASRHGDKVAVADGLRQLTYRALRRAAFHLARRIDALVPAGRPVGILLPNDALFPVAALACLAAGRPYVPIDPSFPAQRIDEITREAAFSAMIIDRIAGEVFYDAGSLPCLDIGTSLDVADEQSLPAAPAAGPAVILYTSGSTGRPKGICNDQRAILQRVAQATNSCHVSADDRFFLLSSPGTIAGTRETFSALLNGATLHIADPIRLGINGVLAMLQEARVTIGYGVPALMRQLLRAPGAKDAFAHARTVRIGGDIPVESDLALCRAVLPPVCRILIAFSSTEVPTIFQWFVPPEWKPDGVRLPVGRPWPGMSFTIEEDGAPVPAGEAGELVVESSYLALGHWQEGRLQPGPFVTDPRDRSVRVLHTGDLVRLRPDGLVEMVGRKDRQIKIHGSRVDVGEVEAVLRGCPGVADCAVIVRRQGEDASALVAYVVAGDPAQALLASDLKQALAARLPWRMRPAQIRVLDTIPHLPGFKVDVRALEKLDRQERAQLDAAPPATAVADDPGTNSTAPAGDARVRTAVEHAWTTVLGPRSFRANIPWDEAGGDSLGALHLWCLIEEALGTRLAIESLESNATPAVLIAALEKRLSPAAAGSAPPAGAAGPPLVFFMPPADGDTPLQAQFRAAFHHQIRFEVVQYPPWRDMIDGGGGFDVLVDAVVAQVVATGGGDIFLAGYSFGGFVAWETARRLAALKRRVSFVGLIDTQREFQSSSPQGRIAKAGNLIRAVSRPRDMCVAAMQRSLKFLARKSAFRPLRQFGRLASLLPATAAFTCYYHLNYQLRVQAMRRSPLRPSAAPTYLFRTDEFSVQAAESTWGGLAADLKVISVGGAHLSVLRPPARENLCRQFLQAVHAARPPAQAATT